MVFFKKDLNSLSGESTGWSHDRVIVKKYGEGAEQMVCSPSENIQAQLDEEDLIIALFMFWCVLQTQNSST